VARHLAASHPPACSSAVRAYHTHFPPAWNWNWPPRQIELKQIKGSCSCDDAAADFYCFISAADIYCGTNMKPETLD